MIGLDNTRKHLSVAGIDLTQKYGVWTSGGEVFNAPAYDFTMVSVPGRNGDLYLSNNRYQNIPINYPCICRNFTPEMALKLKQDVFGVGEIFAVPGGGRTMGYLRIEDGRDPDHYRMGVPIGPFMVDQIVWNNNCAYFTLSFNCKPQRFLKNQPLESVTGPASNWLVEPLTYAQSAPVYTLRRSGLGGTRVMINGMEINIRSTYEYNEITLDAETQTALYLPQNKNVANYIYIVNEVGAEYDQRGGIPYSDRFGSIISQSVPSGLTITVDMRSWVL